jgi:hypothetical protein
LEFGAKHESAVTQTVKLTLKPRWGSPGLPARRCVAVGSSQMSSSEGVHGLAHTASFRSISPVSQRFVHKSVHKYGRNGGVVRKLDIPIIIRVDRQRCPFNCDCGILFASTTLFLSTARLLSPVARTLGQLPNTARATANGTAAKPTCVPVSSTLAVARASQHPRKIPKRSTPLRTTASQHPRCPLSATAFVTSSTPRACPRGSAPTTLGIPGSR